MLNGIVPRMHVPAGFGFGHRDALRRSQRQNDGTDAISTPAAPGTSTTSASSVSATSHLAAELKLVTREGDTVTLDWSRDAQATYTSARTAADSDGDGDIDSTTTIDSLERSVKTAFSLNVQGDLNDQEKADLDRILRAVKHALRDFAHGDTQGAAADIARVQDSGTTASLQVDFQSSFSLNAVRAQATTSTAPVRPPADTVPVDPAPIVDVSATPARIDALATTPANPSTPRPANGSVLDADGDHDGDTASELGDRLRQARENLRAWVQAGSGAGDSPAHVSNVLDAAA